MTHEIHVVARVDDHIDEGRLLAGLIAGRWQAPPDTAGLGYANPDTGVRASIEPLTTDGLPAGYVGLGMALVLNYVRPAWFAIEAIQSFSGPVTAAGGLAFDPQMASTPGPPDPDALVASWVAGNDAAVRSARATGAVLPWLDPARSSAWWRHQRALPQLRLAFAATHYVPSMRLIRRAGSDRVERAMSWPDAVPALLPETDRIVLLRSAADTQLTIVGVAPAEAVRTSLEGLTERLVA